MNENQKRLYNEAYQYTIDRGGPSQAYTYLSRAVLSGRHAAPALQAIANGLEAALKEKGYI